MTEQDNARQRRRYWREDLLNLLELLFGEKHAIAFTEPGRAPTEVLDPVHEAITHLFLASPYSFVVGGLAPMIA
jgi:hypothetical protein